MLSTAASRVAGLCRARSSFMRCSRSTEVTGSPLTDKALAQAIAGRGGRPTIAPAATHASSEAARAVAACVVMARLVEGPRGLIEGSRGVVEGSRGVVEDRLGDITISLPFLTCRMSALFGRAISRRRGPSSS